MKYRINKKTEEIFFSGLRGAMVRDIGPSEVDSYYNIDGRTGEDNLRELRSWGANLIRWRISGGENPNLNWTYDYVRKRLEHLRETLQLCEEIGMKVIVVLMDTPGGRISRTDSRNAMFYNSSLYQEFLQIWEMIASDDGIRNHPALYAYDLMNEPNHGMDNLVINWRDAHIEAGLRIRQYDTDTPIAIEPVGGEYAYANLEPFVGIGKVYYQFHFYTPHCYTHQMVHDPSWHNSWSFTNIYPGVMRYRETFNGEEKTAYYDKSTLIERIKPIVDWQIRYPGNKIFAGEFSTACWSPNATEWLKDVIGLFELHNWDWCYHAFREWPGWSVEHNGTSSYPHEFTKLESDSDRKKVLLKAFEKNTRVRSALIKKL